MMGEIVARNMYSKAIAENKNAIVASCWTYFTTMSELCFYLLLIYLTTLFFSTDCKKFDRKLNAE
jgi:hypothetical protein